MTEEAVTLIGVLAKHGPGFLVAGIVLMLYFFEKKSLLATIKAERERSAELANMLITLSTDSIRADTEHVAAIQSLTKVLDSIDRRVQ